MHLSIDLLHSPKQWFLLAFRIRIVPYQVVYIQLRHREFRLEIYANRPQDLFSDIVLCPRSIIPEYWITTDVLVGPGLLKHTILMEVLTQTLKL